MKFDSNEKLEINKQQRKKTEKRKKNSPGETLKGEGITF
jgi:hypothetical protein